MIFSGKDFIASQTGEWLLHMHDDVFLQILSSFAFFFTVRAGQPVTVHNPVVPVQRRLGNEELVALRTREIADFVCRVHGLAAAVADLER